VVATFSRRAVLRWEGDIPDGSGRVVAGSEAFDARAIFPTLAGDPPHATTPEELLAASHAVCYGIGLRGLIARRGGKATRVTVTATVTANKGKDGIRIQSSHLDGRVEGLEGLNSEQLQQAAHETYQNCTISVALRGTVAVSFDVRQA
jgi:lipoyl-dependent peroxiredoxin